MDQYFMEKAIQLARAGQGQTLTNPLVGAVIVYQGTIVATGCHLQYGGPHAEVNALKNCPEEILAKATMYVTLEPCSHQGKQPPCSQAIIQSGIKQVVIGQLDPNPLVAGRGQAMIRENGVEVESGVLEAECKQLNPFYNFFHQNKRPFITLKQASSLDGKISLRDIRTPITGSEVYQYVRRERKKYQAILVGSQTAITDDPSLHTIPRGPYPPLRIVLDRRGRLKDYDQLQLFHDKDQEVWIFSEDNPPTSLPDHCRWIVQEKVTIESLVDYLSQEGVQSLYVEGGARIHDAFIKEGLWDAFISYLAPKIIAGNGLPATSSDRVSQELLDLKDVKVQQIGQDIRISGRR